MPKSLISNRHVKNYQKKLDEVRNSLGREVLVYVGSGVPTANWDWVNNEPINPNEAVTYDWEVHTVEKALITWNNKEDFVFSPGGRVETGDCVIKCKLEDVLASGTDVNNKTIFHIADKVIVDGEACKVMKPPKKGGLRDLYTVEVTLERVDPF